MEIFCNFRLKNPLFLPSSISFSLSLSLSCFPFVVLVKLIFLLAYFFFSFFFCVRDIRTVELSIFATFSRLVRNFK